MSLTDTLTRVLAEHHPGDYTHLFPQPRGAVLPPVQCRCGWRGPGAYRAHVAAALVAAIRADEVLVEAAARAINRADDEALESSNFGTFCATYDEQARAALDAICGGGTC